MKCISLIFLVIFTLTLSGCFTKNTQEKGDIRNEGESQIWDISELEIIKEPTNVSPSQEPGEVTQDSQVDTSTPQQWDSISEADTTSEAEITQETAPEESLELEVEELESYEEDLEDLFKDILWEFDDSSASE